MSADITTRSEFYAECFKRAFRGKLAHIELASGLLALVAVPVGLWLWPNASGAMNWLPLAIFGAVFVGTVAVGLATAPYWIHGELEQDRNKLRLALDKRADRRAAIARLWQLRADGVPHRNDPIEPADFPAWLAKYQAWRADVLAQALVVSEGLQAWLEILDRMEAPPAYSSQSVNTEHNRFRHIMSEILLRLQKFLEAEMLNKDIARTEY